MDGVTFGAGQRRGVTRTGIGLVACAILAGVLATPPAAAETASTIMQRHFGTLRVNGAQAAGERPLAVALLDFEDMRMPQNRAYYDWLWFEEGDPANGLNVPADVGRGNVRSAFLENSYGRFTWRRAGLFGPFRYPDDTRTTADESRSACVLEPETCPGIGLVTIRTSDGENMWKVHEPGAGGVVDAAATDPNRNGEGITLIDVNGSPLLSGDYVHLVSFHGNYIEAENGGGGGLVATNRGPSNFGRFMVTKRSGSFGNAIRHEDRFAIQAYNSQYIAALNGGGGAVRADRNTVGTWETFTLMEQAHNNARQIRTAMELSIAAGFDPSPYDVDKDALVERDELAFVRVLSNPTGWGQENTYLPRHRPPRGRIDVEPSQAVFDAFASLATIVHEVAHALDVEHVYGSQTNSALLTPMSGTVGPGDSDQFDRDTYHLDPWTKFRLGWMKPVLIRTDTPVNACRPIDAADDDSSFYLHGASDGWFRPALLYDETRPNEYWMLEYRKRAGYDANVASEGLAVWRIMLNEDGTIVDLPGQRIKPGKDGILQSRPSGDDVFEYIRDGDETVQTVAAGPNRWRDSVVDPADVLSWDPANISIGAPSSLWGGNQLWTSANGVFRPFGADRRPSNLYLQAGVPSEFSMEVETSVGGPFRPSLSSISPTVAPTSTVFRIRGQLGVRGVKRIEARNTATGAVYLGSVQKWRCDQADVRFSMPAGVYDVTVVGDDVKIRSASQRIVIFPIRII